SERVYKDNDIIVHGKEFFIADYRPALFLDRIGITQIDEIKGFHKITYLEHLDLSRNKINSLPWGTGSKYTSNDENVPPCLKFLMWLDLSENDLMTVEWISAVPNVRTLLLHGNPRIDPDDLLKKTKKCLQHLAFLTYDREGIRKARFFKTTSGHL
ncbi:MAG: hypothetical protein Q6365_022180, partial [Candidatus Sigynarchaeota archaeon]